jgi:hypothetical protein
MKSPHLNSAGGLGFQDAWLVRRFRRSLLVQLARWLQGSHGPLAGKAYSLGISGGHHWSRSTRLHERSGALADFLERQF